jgi:hypothetical protein
MHAIEKIRPRIGKQDIYLLNTFDGCVLKIPIQPEVKYAMKFKGGTEYRVEPSANIVYDTLSEANEITKEEYEKY